VRMVSQRKTYITLVALCPNREKRGAENLQKCLTNIVWQFARRT